MATSYSIQRGLATLSLTQGFNEEETSIVRKANKLIRDLLTPFHYGDIPALAKTNFGDDIVTMT